MKGLAMQQGKRKKKSTCCKVTPEDERQAWDAVIEMYHNALAVTSREQVSEFKSALNTLMPEDLREERLGSC